MHTYCSNLLPVLFFSLLLLLMYFLQILVGGVSFTGA